MSHNSAISNPYAMQSVPKERTPMEVQVNGKYAVCHRCGRVRVKTLTTFHLGRSRDGHPASIRLCSVCNSVIQSPIPAGQPKQLPADGKANQKIYALLAHLIHGEREGWKLARMLDVSQPTVWTYLWELKRNGLVVIGKDGHRSSLKMVDVTYEGFHHFDVEKES